MRLIAAASLLALAALPAHALYKIVGPDGRVTYTDRPPSTQQGQAVPLGRDAAADATPDVALPLLLREAMTRFPVVLYAAPDCQPCDAGRALLQQRGIPFRERTAGTTNAAAEAWRQQTGSPDAPVLMVGTQALRGFSPGEWHSYLDTAGYPRESLLPRNYVAPAPTPIVPPPAPRDAAPAASPRPAAPATVAPPPAPGGIRF